MRTQRELYGVARSRFQIHPPQQVVEARVVAEGVVAQMGAVMDYDLNDLAVPSTLVLLGGRCCLLLTS